MRTYKCSATSFCLRCKMCERGRISLRYIRLHYKGLMSLITAMYQNELSSPRGNSARGLIFRIESFAECYRRFSRDSIVNSANKKD